jgi:GNAT superfamily N-acetyltransferase
MYGTLPQSEARATAMPENIAIQIEPYHLCHADLEPMLRKLYDEALRPNTGRVLRFNKAERLRREMAGRFVVAVARNDVGDPIGFASFSLNVSWTDGAKVAQQDTVYLLTPYRKGWLHRKLWRAAEAECFKRGADEIQFLAPATLFSRLALWFRMGYRQTGVQLTKRAKPC